ncbi:hypothetical protein HY480_03840 [Candidatus Uhrbacteria bacterium]|nr:hypothetical protein [Candidatus Uhrbacteria bacterium]
MHATRQWITRSVIVIAIAMTVLPSPAFAQDVQTDAKCWPQAQCTTAGGTFDATSGSCGAPGWGYCFVQKPIKIAIDIPGVQGKQVADLREYLIRIYQYGIVVAAILAVVVIMIGGVIWLTSGGADRLKTAQQWIGNAIIGLLLVLGSYVLLQTINPDLVRLQLPRTLMLRPISLGAKFCSLVDPNTQVLQRTTVIPTSDYAQLPCGETYKTTGAAQKTCFGDFCPTGSVCIPTGTTTFRCESGTIGGEVVGDGVAFLDNNIELHVVCADGSTHQLAAMDGTQVEEKQRHKYVFPKGSVTIPEIERACHGATSNGTRETSVVRGFFLKLDVNDGDLFGAAYARSGDSDDDWFAIGPDGCGGSSQPLQTPRNQAVNGPVEYETDPSSIAWSFLPKDKLFPQMKIYNAIRDVNPIAFTCNIGLSRGAFPARR